MIVFWIAAALAAAAAAALILWRAAKPGAAEAANPAAELYARQLAELQAERDRGLLDEAGFAAARAEAARRLLKAGEEPAPVEAPAGRRERLTVLGVAVGAALVAAGVYAVVGSPGRGDEPFAARKIAWQKAVAATGDPSVIPPAALAVLLEDVAKKQPNDPELQSYIGRVRFAAGDSMGAAAAFERAVRLDPNRPDDWSGLGVSLAAGDEGKVGPAAKAAFERAVKLNPEQPDARYFLGRAALAEGRPDQALAYWRPLRAQISADDPRAADLDRMILAAEASASGPEGQNAMIRAMVQRQAAELETQPDNPQGWARLIRAYAVLGDGAAHDRALAQARALFAKRPKDLALIEAAAE